MDQWAAPQAVTDIDVAFPARALELMPPHVEIPEVAIKWQRFQSDWFTFGLPPDCEIDLQPGVDGEAAMRHLKVIQGSFAPTLAHKMAAVAYLASRWFRDVRYTAPLW